MKRAYSPPSLNTVVIRYDGILTGSQDSIGVATGAESIDGNEALVNERHYEW